MTDNRVMANTNFVISYSEIFCLNTYCGSRRGRIASVPTPNFEKQLKSTLWEKINIKEEPKAARPNNWHLSFDGKLCSEDSFSPSCGRVDVSKVKTRAIGGGCSVGGARREEGVLLVTRDAFGAGDVLASPRIDANLHQNHQVCSRDVEYSPQPYPWREAISSPRKEDGLQQGYCHSHQRLHCNDYIALSFAPMNREMHSTTATDGVTLIVFSCEVHYFPRRPSSFALMAREVHWTASADGVTLPVFSFEVYYLPRRPS